MPICAVLCWAGCGVFSPAAAPDVDPCAAEIIRLEAQRVIEISTACQGYSFDQCKPLIEEIDKKYEPKILAQVKCGSSDR